MLALIFIVLFTFTSPAQNLRPIYDARKSPQPTKVSSLEMAILNRDVKPAAKRFWNKRGEECESEFEAIDVAQGSFTKASSAQKVILYRYCPTGHNFALNGVAIFEDGRLVSHYGYEGSWDNAIGSLPDIDGNGLSEILIATSGTNQGITWGVVSIIELSDKEIRKFGITDTYSDNCGAQEKGTATAYRLSAIMGATPAFQRETFVSRDCGGSGAWSKSGEIKQVAMRKDKVEYKRIK